MSKLRVRVTFDLLVRPGTKTPKELLGEIERAYRGAHANAVDVKVRVVRPSCTCQKGWDSDDSRGCPRHDPDARVE